MNYFQIIISLYLLVSYLVSSQDVVGCGGFIKSNVPIKFEKIEVKLYAKHGAFKFKTECAPNNGYFLVAVYDKGDYLLRIDPPQGWGFDPQEIELQIDGKNDPCSKGEDINFNFSGFTVSGKVGSLGREQGPSGVQIKLLDQDQKNVADGVTDEVGSFVFKNVMPGDYLVKASHTTWILKKDEVAVKVIDDNVQAENLIQIAGYDVKGHVLSGGVAIQGVSFILFTTDADKKDVTGCTDIPEDGLASVKHESQEKPLCFVVSQKDGSFVFPTISSGNYILIPFYKAHNIIFDIVPSKLSFEVNLRSIILKTPFQVYGFSVQGSVLDNQGVGIADVMIVATGVSGEERKSVSKVDGTYLLENVTTGSYSFELTKEDFFFDVETIHITPNTPHLKDIKVKKYSLCGQVDIHQLPAKVLLVNQHKVLFQLEGAQNSDIVSVSPDKSGKFCFKAEPGKYKVEVPVSSNEKKLGFMLKPAEHLVEVKDVPILNLKFEQFLASVEGKVQCLEQCVNVAVYLVSTEDTTNKVFANMEGTGNEMEFKFANVLPGKYKIAAQKRKWCWNPVNVEIEVKDADISNILFAHSGYYLKCSISHNIILNFTLENSNEIVGSFELKKGTNQFCLKTPGVYSLTPRSCYRFEKSTYTYDTAVPKSLTLDVESYKLELKVKAHKKINDINLIVRSLSSNKEETIAPILVEEESGMSYTTLHWGRLSEEFLITPLSREVLFYPETHSVAIKESCPGGTVEFEGREGVFIEGQIYPPFAAVLVTITTLPKNEKIEVLTDDLGKYRIGPMHSDIQYEVSASKEGYHISPKKDQKGSFTAEKLCHVTVKVSDEVDAAMASVLLSLSGGQYRSNSLTVADGSFVFSNLGPGQYFLRPMQKEYSFEPSSKMIDVTEGEDVVVHIKGKQVAFSCSGSVSTLSGIPEEKVAIEAIGLHKCSEFHESTTSDKNGNYRLRGLQPGCSYNIRLAQSNDNIHVERLAPFNLVVNVQQEDIRNKNFLIFYKPTKFYISADIHTHLDLLPSLKVLLYDEENMESPVHAVSPGVVKYILFPPLKPKTYVVKLQTTISSKTHLISSTSATVTPDENLNKQHISLKFEAKKRLIDLEPTQSVITLPLAVACVFLAYNYDSVLVFLMTVNSFIQNFTKAESSDTDSDQDEEKSSKKKKR